MNWIEKMIAEQCPNGVEKMPLGGLITRSREKAKECKADVYAVTNNRGFVKSDSLHEFSIYSADTSNYSIVRKNNIAYNPSRLNIGSIALFNDEVGLISPMYVVFNYDTSVLSPKFLFLFLKSDYVSFLVDSKKEVGARFRFDFNKWNDIYIPLPPLSIQKEIVNVLDKFSELIEKTDEEIALRQKQYEYYGNVLFSQLSTIEKQNIDTVCDIYDGVHQTPKYVDKGIKFVSVENIKNLYQTTKFITEEAYQKIKNKPQRGDLFMTRITAGVIGECSIVDKDEPLGYYVSLALLRPKNSVCSEYLRAYLHSPIGKQELYKWVKVDATPTKINKGDIGKVQIPLPSPSRQQEIVDILDKFEALISKLKEERELRQKQYEYYREKLLTF